MLLLRVEYNANYYKSLLHKLTKIKRSVPAHVDVFARGGTVFVMSLDDGLSAAFLYAAYLKAKKKGLNADLMYARYIDEGWLPEEVRKTGEKWLSRRLSGKNVKMLRSRSITEHIFARW
jgi:hypothetical protein